MRYGSSALGLPYVVATAALSARLDLAPLGIRIRAEHCFDPTRLSSERFLDRLERLDAHRYGALGMKSPRWALYDCAELPGAIVGFGRHARDLDPERRAALDAGEGEDGLCPVSMVVATPMLGEHCWLVQAMSAPGGALGATLSVALAALGARRVTFTTQWDSGDLDALAGLGPLEVLAAWLPAHDHPATCVLRLDVDEVKRRRGAPGAAGTVDVLDKDALQQLQGELEGGVCVRVVGQRAAAGASSLVPIARSEPE